MIFPHSRFDLFVNDLFARLLEYAGNYFDLKDLPDGETKRSFQRVVNKTAGRVVGRGDSGAEGKREKKKRRKE